MGCTCTDSRPCVTCYNSKVRPSVEKSHAVGEAFCRVAHWCKDPTVVVVGCKLQSRLFPILAAVRRGFRYPLKDNILDYRIKRYVNHTALDIKVNDGHLVRINRSLCDEILRTGPLGLSVREILKIKGGVSQLRSRCGGKITVICNVAFPSRYDVQKHRTTRRHTHTQQCRNLKLVSENHQ